MTDPDDPLRLLHDALMRSDAPVGEILGAWRGPVRGRLGELASLGRREPPPPGPGDDGYPDHLERLYALHALGATVDYLVERGCPGGVGTPGVDTGDTGDTGETGETGGRRLDVDALAEYAAFLEAVGLSPVDGPGGFSPFHHEVFAVVQDDDARHIRLEAVLWPGFRLGDLHVARAGVRVRAPRHLLDAHVATTSTLYFTQRRDPRRTHDLAHGWGSNSRWATAAPRWYDDAEGLHLNWDGTIDIGADDPPNWGPPDGTPAPPIERRRELLEHRCFVRAPLPDDERDWNPYDDRMTLPSVISSP